MNKINASNYDCIVVGSGFAGSVIANVMASVGCATLVVEKRKHVGGNMFESYVDKDYSRIHLYGPHIFHTNNEEVFHYLSNFTSWYPYEHKVIGSIDGKLVPIPFNFDSLDNLFDQTQAELIKKTLLDAYPDQPTVSIRELINSTNPIIKEFGEYVYEKVFVHYTAKQWGVPIEQVDSSVINRVPVRLGYNGNYFGDKYQFMPSFGYNTIFENMLSSPNITVVTDCDVAPHLTFGEKLLIDGEVFDKPFIFTGAVDQLLNYRLGVLPYRTTKLVFQKVEKEFYQNASVVNYPNEHEYTRITEFKHMTGEVCPHSTILYEYPSQYKVSDNAEPFYPILNEANNALYQQYVDFVKKYPNVTLCGRLAEYKYYDMDKCVEKALSTARRLVEQLEK